MQSNYSIQMACIPLQIKNHPLLANPNTDAQVISIILLAMGRESARRPGYAHTDRAPYFFLFTKRG